MARVFAVVLMAVAFLQAGALDIDSEEALAAAPGSAP
jgi:hypothetical protein